MKATKLWRGIIGPDLTIYVQDVGEEDARGYNPVELVTSSVLVVRSPWRRDSDGLWRVQMDEKLERRLGFEVLEWVRSTFLGEISRV